MIRTEPQSTTWLFIGDPKSVLHHVTVSLRPLEAGRNFFVVVLGDKRGTPLKKNSACIRWVHTPPLHTDIVSQTDYTQLPSIMQPGLLGFSYRTFPPQLRRSGDLAPVPSKTVAQRVGRCPAFDWTWPEYAERKPLIASWQNLNISNLQSALSGPSQNLDTLMSKSSDWILPKSEYVKGAKHLT